METDEFVELRALPWRVPVEVIRARYTTFEFPTHAHAEFTIAEVLQGSECFSHLGREVEARTGWFIHINPSEAHTGRAAEGSWTYVSVYPSVEFLRWACPALCVAGDPHFPAPVSHQPAMRGRLVAFVRRAFDGADDLELQSELLELLSALVRPIPRAASVSTGHSAAITRIRERLADEWDHNLGLAELAESESMSALTLLRAFRAEVGCTPQVYRTARRIAMARALVRQGGELAAVAARCGFTDQSHFTSTFRRWTGMTPGQYRAFVRPGRSTPRRMQSEADGVL